MAAADRMRTWSCPTRGVFYPWILVFIVSLSTINVAVAAPETGLWNVTVVNTSRPLLLRKSMYKDTDIQLKVLSFHCPEDVTFTVHWYLKYYPCHNEFNNIEEMYEKTPLSRGEGLDPNPLSPGEFIEHKHAPILCNNGLRTLKMLRVSLLPSSAQHGDTSWRLLYLIHCVFQKAKADPRPVSPPGEAPDENDTRWITEEYESSSMNSSLHIKDDVIATTWKDGPYLLVVKIVPSKQDANWNLTVKVVMKGSHGYISITEWPLMIFYMVMCIVYILYALLWFIWAACYWKDLLRIQFWIAGVIFLGMVEKAVFCAEYENTNTVGSASPGLLIFAELVSALKRTLARLLVIIVSLGYGIVKY
ncbi:Transmembrane protein 87A, partial [Nibea albiflora]